MILTEQHLLELRCELEELITKRCGMMAENSVRESLGQAVAYDERTFDELRRNIKNLKENLVCLAERKNSIEQLLQACNIVNSLPITIADIARLKRIPLETIDVFEHVLHGLKHCLKLDSQLFGSDFRLKLLARLTNAKGCKELPEKVKKLRSLEYGDLLNNIAIICAKDKES